MIEIEMLKHQEEFLFNSPQKYTLLCGGIGSGKSWSGSHYVIRKCVEDGNGLGLICANTYRQLMDSTLSCLFRELEKLHVPYKYTHGKNHLALLGSDILCRSLEGNSYEYIRGVELGWFWADEVRDTKEDAYRVLIGRLRDRRTQKLEGRLTSSPAGFTWLYDYFEGEKRTSEYKLIHADSRDNPFLPVDYLKSLLETYDPKIIEQEIEGRFVNVTSGKVYYAFDRNKHVKEFEDKSTPKKSGADFNVNPITSCMGYYENDIIYICDEIYKKDSNTFELADAMVEKWGQHECYPDATGKARKSSAVKTDHQILKDRGLTVMYNPNPHVRDRYNCINGLFHHGRLFIHPRCKMLIKDLEQFSHENKNPMLSHISDAMGYLCWGLAPLRSIKKTQIFNL